MMEWVEKINDKWNGCLSLSHTLFTVFVLRFILIFRVLLKNLFTQFDCALLNNRLMFNNNFRDLDWSRNQKKSKRFQWNADSGRQKKNHTTTESAKRARLAKQLTLKRAKVRPRARDGRGGRNANSHNHHYCYFIIAIFDFENRLIARLKADIDHTHTHTPQYFWNRLFASIDLLALY